MKKIKDSREFKEHMRRTEKFARELIVFRNRLVKTEEECSRNRLILYDRICDLRCALEAPGQMSIRHITKCDREILEYKSRLGQILNHEFSALANTIETMGTQGLEWYINKTFTLPGNKLSPMDFLQCVSESLLIKRNIPSVYFLRAKVAETKKLHNISSRDRYEILFFGVGGGIPTRPQLLMSCTSRKLTDMVVLDLIKRAKYERVAQILMKLKVRNKRFDANEPIWTTKSSKIFGEYVMKAL